MAVKAGLLGDPAVASTGRLVASRYRLRSLLGRGGMSLVWLARDELLHRPVALKQLIPSSLALEETRAAARARALNEARAGARVDHVGAVVTYDVIEAYESVWIAMELLSGRTLEETLRAEGPLPIVQVTSIGLRLLDVLQAIHQAGMVHCDVKPGNVHLCDGGRVVLTDFGIACATGEDGGSPTGEITGSPAYISPERVRGGEVGPAADLFSFGATLFAAVEGRSPFDRGSVFATLAAIAQDPPPPFRRAGLLRSVIEGLLTKDPERRLRTAQARAALRAIQHRP
jgi:eukaryotic-like serine/threonine-protein kinase